MLRTIILSFLYWNLMLAVSLSHADEVRIAHHGIGMYGFVPNRLLTEAYQRIGHDAVFISCGMTESLIMVNDGMYDAEVCRAKGIQKEYPNLMCVPVPLFSVELVALSLKPTLLIKSWKDLKGKRVGYLAGIKAMEDKLVNWVKPVAYYTLDQGLLLLREGRVDYIVYERKLAMRELMEMGAMDVYLHLPPIETVDLYHYVHKRRGEDVQKLTKVLQCMEKSGFIKRINTGLPN